MEPLTSPTMQGAVKHSSLYHSLSARHTSTGPHVENMVKGDSSDYVTFFPHLCTPVPMRTLKRAVIFVVRGLCPATLMSCPSLCNCWQTCY